MNAAAETRLSRQARRGTPETLSDMVGPSKDARSYPWRVKVSTEERLRYHPAAVKRALLFPLVLFPVLHAAADEVVPWTAATDCVGHVCAVSGTVAEVESREGAVRLYFDKERRDVCVTLVRSWLVSWPDYVGRNIVANGPVRRFRDLTEISVHDPSEITLTEAGPTPGIEYVAPEKEEVQDLRDEVQRLEKRVKELESR